MKSDKSRSVGSFVAEDYRAASVFSKYGIDFCCRGGVSIEEVSAANNLDPDKLLREVEAATSETSTAGIDFKTWELDLLTDYIEKKHHRYILRAAPVIIQYLDKICEVHGMNHPELLQIRDEFNISISNLMSHMQKEEKILFPYIRDMIAAAEDNSQFQKGGFSSVKSPIAVMMQEHDAEGERFRTISRLSNNYTTPDDACRTYQVAFSMIREFEADLHHHIHLENNILFPRAIEMEAELVA